MTFKDDCNALTELIESCFDWNVEEDDGLTFDQRLNKKLKEQPHLRKFYDEHGIGATL